MPGRMTAVPTRDPEEQRRRSRRMTNAGLVLLALGTLMLVLAAVSFGSR